jgi:hypothetical protein
MTDMPTQPLSDEDKRSQLRNALTTVIRLAKELPVEVDPYAGVNIPDPIGETIDVSDHPAIHQAVSSFKAAEAEVGIATAVLNIARQIGETFGLAI